MDSSASRTLQTISWTQVELLNSKFANPMLGLYGLSLYLRNPSIRVGLCATVFENLYSMLGPHPDLIALGWGALQRSDMQPQVDSANVERLKNALEQAGQMVYPPTLTESWRILSTASHLALGCRRRTHSPARLVKGSSLLFPGSFGRHGSKLNVPPVWGLIGRGLINFMTGLINIKRCIRRM